MIIKKVELYENQYSNYFIFDSLTNIIYSNGNTAGKTSLLKLILFSLGYNIDKGTLNKFKKCRVVTTLDVDGKDVKLVRSQDSFICIKDGKSLQISKENEIPYIAQLLGINNKFVSNNLLGTHYIGQDKGWSLYNKGQDNSVKFDIDEMILGLSNVDCENLIQKKNVISKELDRNKKILKMMKSDSENHIYDLYSEEYAKADLTPLDEIQKELDEKHNMKLVLQKELSKLQEIKEANQKMLKLILDMKLIVIVDNKHIAIKKDNLYKYEDNELILDNQISSISKKLKKTEKELDDLITKQKQILESIESYKLIKTLSISPVYDSGISSKELSKTIAILSAEYQKINDEIDKILSEANLYLELNALIKEYSEKLGVSEEVKKLKNCSRSARPSYSSGAKRMMLVLAYRLAYLDFLKLKQSISLPLIIDSPAQELDQKNLSLMLDVLKEKFSNHQIIIATTTLLDLPYAKKIILASNSHLICNVAVSQKKIDEL